MGMNTNWFYLHNPKCSKSRLGLDILTNKKFPFREIRYLEAPLKAEFVHHFVSVYEGDVKDLVRHNDLSKLSISVSEWSVKSVVDLILVVPSVLQRPLLVGDDKAILGRPVENFLAVI